MKVPLLDVKAQISTCKNDLLNAIQKVIEDAHFILGPEVKQFEQKLVEYTGAKYAIGCASGTDALLLSLRALDLSAGDEVITTPFTFFATAGAVSNAGATPVFVDIDEKTFNIDPAQIEAKITSKTKCIIPVHLFGQCADMDPIMAIAKKYKLKVIEDAAQSLGALYKGKMSGTMGDLGCYSFFPSKNLGCIGDAGLIVSNDAALAEKVAMLRVHGSKQKYIHAFVGTNSRLDTIQAASLLIKLPYLNEWAQKRAHHAQIYTQAFKTVSAIKTPVINPDCHHVFNQYTICVPRRDELQKYLTDKEIGTAIYYPLCLHLQQCFSHLGYCAGDFPVAEKISRECISLPVYPELSSDQQEYVIQTIKGFYK